MADQPIFLAIDTATEIGSVGIFEGETLLGSIEIRKAKSHARLLTPMIANLLGDLDLQVSDLSAVAVSAGPGSYTGLRVGVSTAKGLCLAQDLPLIGIGSLEVLAWQVWEMARELKANICPMIDARRMEVYTALFDAEVTEREDIQAKIVESGSMDDWLAHGPLIFIGDGVKKCQEVLGEHQHAILLPSILNSVSGLGPAISRRFAAGSFEDLVSFEPFYLKAPRTTKPKNPLFRSKKN